MRMWAQNNILSPLHLRKPENIVLLVSLRKRNILSFSRCQSRYDLDARNECAFHWLGVPAVIRVYDTCEIPPGSCSSISTFPARVNRVPSPLLLQRPQCLLKSSLRASPCRTIGSIYTFLRLLLAKYRVRCHVLYMQIYGPIA
jgi:hypothetical protein